MINLNILHVAYLFLTASTFLKGQLLEDTFQCDLPPTLVEEIAKYNIIVDKIKECLMNGPCKGTTYNHLAEFVDKFGNRIAGSKNLEDAIDYMLNKSIAYGLENVHGEQVDVIHWVRGKESAFVLEPRIKKLEVLGLGGSIGTSLEGITAEAIVVDSFDELDKVNASVRGKIVVYNEKYVSYGETGRYRNGAINAAKYGAVASLIRSITPFSMNTPHTGWQFYNESINKIPTACITAEDAHFLRRIQDRGEKIIIRFKMEAVNLPHVISRNTVVDIVGEEQPERIVIVSGHIDSWDVGEGAMDDGGGFMMSWNALTILKHLNLTPKRTLKAILWTAEEEGALGAIQYLKNHENEVDKLIFAMESDIGTFNPIGLYFSGSDYAACIVKEILKHFKSLNATSLIKTNESISYWTPQGIPSASIFNNDETYFWFHHSEADTMDVQDADILDKNTILLTSVAYIVAGLTIDIPRENVLNQN